MINEPYYVESHKQTFPLIVPNKSVVKMLTYQVPSIFGTRSDFLKYILSIQDDYDKIILLNRRDKKQHLESWANWMVRYKRNDDTHMIWYSDDIKQELNHVSYDRDLKHHVDVIYKISDILSIPITYYEDLYGIDRELSLSIIRSWNISMRMLDLNKLLNPQNKYRQIGNRKNLI